MTVPNHETFDTSSLPIQPDFTSFPTPLHTLSHRQAYSTPLPPSTRTPAVSPSSSPFQSEPVEDLIALFQEMFAILETLNATVFSTLCWAGVFCLLYAEADNVSSTNFRETLSRNYPTWQRASQRRSHWAQAQLKNSSHQLQSIAELSAALLFLMDGQYYNGFFACCKFFLCGKQLLRESRLTANVKKQRYVARAVIMLAVYWVVFGRLLAGFFFK